MKLTAIIALGAAVAAAGAYAQDEEASEESVKPAAPKAAKGFAQFSALPFCERATAPAEVQKPGSTEWEAAEEGRFYPLGSFYRTGKGGSMTVSFGKECSARIDDGSEFGTANGGIREKTRTVLLSSGTVEISLARNLPEGAFVVTAPGFKVIDPAGDSKYTYRKLGDGDEAVVRCVTGTMKIEGRHFSIVQMRAADEFRIRSNNDYLETMLYGISGDYIVKLDQGVRETFSVDDEGKRVSATAPATLDWHLSPETKIQIDRAKSAIGSRMSVHTMCFDPAGSLKSECCFCEGRAEINSGELVPAEKTEGDDSAKRAAEATEESAATEEAAEENKENNNEEKEEE